MRAGASAAYTFGRFTLHLDRGALLADGAECALRPKSFALLRHFAENPGRLIDRDEIMEAVWPGIFVTDDSIAQCIMRRQSPSTVLYGVWRSKVLRGR